MPKSPEGYDIPSWFKETPFKFDRFRRWTEELGFWFNEDWMNEAGFAKWLSEDKPDAVFYRPPEKAVPTEEFEPRLSPTGRRVPLDFKGSEREWDAFVEWATSIDVEEKTLATIKYDRDYYYKQYLRERPQEPEAEAPPTVPLEAPVETPPEAIVEEEEVAEAPTAEIAPTAGELVPGGPYVSEYEAMLAAGGWAQLDDMMSNYLREQGGDVETGVALELTGEEGILSIEEFNKLSPEEQAQYRDSLSDNDFLKFSAQFAPEEVSPEALGPLDFKVFGKTQGWPEEVRDIYENLTKEDLDKRFREYLLAQRGYQEAQTITEEQVNEEYDKFIQTYEIPNYLKNQSWLQFLETDPQFALSDAAIKIYAKYNMPVAFGQPQVWLPYLQAYTQLVSEGNPNPSTTDVVNATRANARDFFIDNPDYMDEVPATQLAVSEPGRAVAPLVAWLAKQEAIKAGKTFDLRNVYLAAENALEKEGILDPTDMEIAQKTYEQALEKMEQQAQDLVKEWMAEEEMATPEMRASYLEKARQQIRDDLPPMPPVSFYPAYAGSAATLEKQREQEPKYTAQGDAYTQYQETLKQWYPEGADYLNQYFPETYREFQSQTAKTGIKGGAEYPDPRYPGQNISTMETVNIGEQDFMKWLSMKGKDFFGTLIPPKSPTRTTRARFL